MKKITFIRFLAFLILLFTTTIGFSQIIQPNNITTGGSLCPSGGCTANSIEINRAFIGQSDGTPITNCNQSGPYYVFVDVSKNGAKYDMLVQFELSVNGAASTLYTIKYYGQVSTSLYKTIEVPGWVCGDELELKNILVSWDTSSDNIANCPPDNQYSQCNGKLPNITVDAPLKTNFSYTRNCNNIIATTDIGGGKLYQTGGLTPIQTPYTLKINYGDGTGDFTVSPDLYDDANQEFDDYVFSSHSFPVNNTANPVNYTITLTVTDTATPTPATSIKTSTVTIYPQLAGLTLTPSPTSCNGALGNITASGVTGGNGTYTYSINGGLNYQSSTSFSGLANG
ncbi:MAG: hypothetical protein PSX42_06590, partial [bacterium]|nr:hypothetical protein [bacterium]